MIPVASVCLKLAPWSQHWPPGFTESPFQCVAAAIVQSLLSLEYALQL